MLRRFSIGPYEVLITTEHTGSSYNQPVVFIDGHLTNLPWTTLEALLARADGEVLLQRLLDAPPGVAASMLADLRGGNNGH